MSQRSFRSGVKALLAGLLIAISSAITGAWWAAGLWNRRYAGEWITALTLPVAYPAIVTLLFGLPILLLRRRIPQLPRPLIIPAAAVLLIAPIAVLAVVVGMSWREMSKIFLVFGLAGVAGGAAYWAILEAGRPRLRVSLTGLCLALIAVPLALGYRQLPKRTWEPRPGLKCPTDQSVDLGAVPQGRPSPEDLALADGLAHRQYGASPSVAVWSMSALGRASYAIIATMTGPGAWRVEGRKTTPVSNERDTPISFQLPKAAAERLETLLADPCLYAEPAVIGSNAPSPEGHSYGCLDGEDIVLDIDFAGKRRTATQSCFTAGLNGEVAALILQAASSATTPPQTAVLQSRR